ncbi:MAG: hypothetical protein RIS94_3109 [Pseudomonadota bacterium]
MPALDGNGDGQEIICARALDSQAEVKHWVRNVPQHPGAFWLPLAGGKFCPDFIDSPRTTQNHARRLRPQNGG